MSGTDPPQARPLIAPPDYRFRSETGDLLPWSHLTSRFEAARNYWIVTASPAGRPHATPIWGIWIDDLLYFDGHPATRWGLNLARNPYAVVHLESATDVAVIEGTVEDLTTDETLAERIVSAWRSKYGRFGPEPATRGVFRLRPTHARAFPESLAGGTAWDLNTEHRAGNTERRSG